jgi:molybdopterin/thiamine biosynthesis adenylyltransferase
VGLLAAELLARSGFRNFELVDPDQVDETNLNRHSGLKKGDIGRFKVKVAKAAIKRACESVGSQPAVEAHAADIYQCSRRVKNTVGACDLILALTDDDLSRIACLDLAFGHGAEYMQAGVRIGQNGKNKIDSIAMEATGAEIRRFCPICAGRLDLGQASLGARRYLGGEIWERAKAEGYIPEEPAPSVMSLNAMVAGSLV